MDVADASAIVESVIRFVIVSIPLEGRYNSGCYSEQIYCDVIVPDPMIEEILGVGEDVSDLFTMNYFWLDLVRSIQFQLDASLLIDLVRQQNLHL